MITRKSISRRAMLRGAGAVVALPLLDAMVPAMTAVAETAAAAEKLKRIGYVYVPMGFNPEHWIPADDSLAELPSSLSPLEKVKDQLTVITNTDLQNAYPGSHATSNSAFLSAARAKRTESADYYNGITVDQIAAKQIGQQTQLPSIELSMDLLSTVGQCDNGYACVYQNNLSWASPTEPLPSEAHPRLVFRNVVRGRRFARTARGGNDTPGQFVGFRQSGNQTDATSGWFSGSESDGSVSNQHS